MATETMTATPLDQILSLVKDLGAGERYDLAMSLLETIKSAVGGQKKRKAKDPEAPKREVKPESYINLVNKVVWPHLQTLAEAQTDPDLKARTRSVDARTQIGVLLWSKIKDLEPSERVVAMQDITLDKVREAYESWVSTSPEKEKKPKAQKTPKIPKIKSEGSTASAGTKSSKSSKGKLANMSEDEKAAFYKARGAAAAAARASNKANKSSEAEAEAVTETAKPSAKPKMNKPKPIASVEEPEFGDEQRAWTDPSDGAIYIRQANMLWASDDGAWVGEYNPKTKTIDRDAPEPSYDD